jgi:hypothetical protein
MDMEDQAKITGELREIAGYMAKKFNAKAGIVIILDDKLHSLCGLHASVPSDLLTIANQLSGISDALRRDARRLQHRQLTEQ